MSNRKLTLIVLIIGIFGGGHLICRLFFIQTALVPGSAMANTIVAGDHVLMVRSFGDIKRGQVVVFQFPEDPNTYIKRVVGLPGGNGSVSQPHGLHQWPRAQRAESDSGA